MTLSDKQHDIHPGSPPADIRIMGNLMIPDERVLDVLNSSKLVENLRDFEISVLAGIITLKYFEANECFTELEDEALKDALMILVEGKVEVSAMVNSEPLSLMLESPGDFARIISFVGGDDMNIRAQLKIRKNSAVLLLRRSKLETLLNSHPSIVYSVMRNLVRYVHGVARRKSIERDEMRNYFFHMHGRY